MQRTQRWTRYLFNEQSIEWFLGSHACFRFYVRAWGLGIILQNTCALEKTSSTRLPLPNDPSSVHAGSNFSDTLAYRKALHYRVTFAERSSGALGGVFIEVFAAAWNFWSRESMAMNILEWTWTASWKTSSPCFSGDRNSTHCVFCIDEQSR